MAHSNDAQNGSGSDGRRPSEAAIDPLSQVCTYGEVGKAYSKADRVSSQQILKRTNTSTAMQKLRTPNTESYAARSQTSLHEASPDKKHSGEAPRDSNASTKADKK